MNPTAHARHPSSRTTAFAVKLCAGFTLIEILVVVVILGVLAAIVIPQFTSAANESRDSSIKMSVNRINQQIEIYQQQHDGNRPTLANFEAQLTQASNASGQTAAVGTSGYALGPYIRELPINPKTGTSTVSDGAYGSSAWYYDETTGEFRANDSAESAGL